jgi:hypothetical protein
MLPRFRVANVRSLRDEQELSFVVSPGEVTRRLGVCGSTKSNEFPRVQRSAFIMLMKAAHDPAGNISAGPCESLLSRMGITPGKPSATSTQAPPFSPL